MGRSPSDPCSSCLSKQLDAAVVPSEKTRIQRLIDATDAEIDNLVYDLCGLTEEEIAIVKREV